MISFKDFFKNKSVKFFLIVFAVVIVITNISVYTISNVQYERESKRQLDAYQEMMEHLITMESEEVALIYTEHFYHTQGVAITLYDGLGNIIYETPIKADMEELNYLYDSNENIIGSFYFDDNSSYLGSELTTGLIIINFISVLLFFAFLKILIWYLNSWYSLLDKDMGYIGEKDRDFNFSDLERVNKRMNELIDSEKRIREFQKEYVKFLAHDIKTPLTVIKAYLEGIKFEKLEMNDLVIKDMLKEIDEVEKLIPKLISNGSVQEKQKLNLAVFISDITKRLEELFMSKNISFELEVLDFELEISEIDITRIIENLLFNSFYYSKESTKISIKLDPYKRELVIRDQGYGMDKETLDLIRKGPYRAKEAFKHYQKGSGMGLQIVFEIIERLGYNLSINSEINQGTEVRITF